MELNVLVEAKKEYMGQLCRLICPPMIQAFHAMYDESNKLSKGKKVLLQYQKLLKDVPNWNDHIVKTHSDNLNNSCSWFSDLLAAVFVSYVKILSSVRLKSDNKKISIKLPSNELFVHTCFINAAQDLYRDPYVYHDEQSEHERNSKLNARFTAAIEETIQALLPVQLILNTYMSQAGTSVELDSETPDTEDAEDPDIHEGPDEEPEPPTEPEPEPEEPVPTGPEVPTPEGPSDHVAPPVSDEIKNVPVTGVPDDVLFGDAPETKTSPITNGHQ